MPGSKIQGFDPIPNSWPWQQGQAMAGVGKHSREQYSFPEIPSPSLHCRVYMQELPTAAGASPLSPVLGIKRAIKRALVPCPGAILGATLITGAGK